MKKLIDAKKQAKIFFKKNKTVVCPAFPKEKITFNSKGLSHLFYKGANKARLSDQIKIRLILLPLAIKVLKKMPFFQEERKFINYEKKLVRFFSFEAVIDNRRIKIIVRQVGNGQKHFWSVIPSWKRIKGERVNCKSKFWKD